MNNLKEVILNLGQDESLEANYTTMKLEQKTRNKCKSLITEALLKDIAEALSEVDGVSIDRVEKGFGLSFSTPCGTLPVFIEATMKGLDFEIADAAKAFVTKKAEQDAKKAERAADKAEKMKADAIKREAKRAEREAKEAAKLAKLQGEIHA